MNNFLQNVYQQLERAAERVVLREVHGDEFRSVSGRELLDMALQARMYLRQAGIKPGERCALLGPNSIGWAAIDLALMAEGIVVVPLYARQSVGELVAMMQDCTPRLLIASDAALAASIAQVWPAAPKSVTFSKVL